MKEEKVLESVKSYLKKLIEYKNIDELWLYEVRIFLQSTLVSGVMLGKDLVYLEQRVANREKDVIGVTIYDSEEFSCREIGGFKRVVIKVDLVESLEWWSLSEREFNVIIQKIVQGGE